ncbi:transposase [Rhizobium ruizarguesonis]|uniref:Transposase n=1 Tax=Rhizobium ruizarguesonis TaxID=2081791 RepID=A0AAE8U2F9_9HYPH|nr:transposase [Rhizobium ruizarguesonis]TBE49313.1 transposase [Rhizobium ruizarguesonis]TBF18456.1 transposase [Rhizobium ruizarguesonis]
MTDKDDEQELAMIAARAAEIKAGLDAAYSVEELRRPLSTRSVHALIAGVTASTAAKLKAISARIEQLEAGGVRYAGTWQRALPYRKGSIVTSGGGMWAALRDTAEGEQPGKALDAWQLSAKSARPAVRVKTETRE